MARTLERFGAIDLLINNAGVGLYAHSWSASMEDVRQLMELNFFALLGMIQLVAPHMRNRRSGMIVNVSSIGGKMPLPWATLYSASKYAVTALTEGLRMAAECARAIRRGVERDARTIMVPRAGWFLVALARLFPSLVEARMAAMNGTA